MLEIALLGWAATNSTIHHGTAVVRYCRARHEGMALTLKWWCDGRTAQRCCRGLASPVEYFTVYVS